MRLLHLAVDGDIELFISEPIIAETLRVLRDMFGWQGCDVFDAGQRLRQAGKVVTPCQTLNVIEHDPPGQPNPRMRGGIALGVHCYGRPGSARTEGIRGRHDHTGVRIP